MYISKICKQAALIIYSNKGANSAHQHRGCTKNFPKNTSLVIKFGFSEKATKFEKIFVVLLTRARNSVLVKKSMKIFFLNVDKLELVSKELNHFGVIAGLFQQIGGHSSRFVLFCSF